MENNEIRLKRTLYKNDRIIIEFFMYLPRCTRIKNTVTLEYNPVVNIRYLSPVETSNFKSTMYTVTPRNLYRVFSFFNHVLSWFVDTSMPDLYVRGDDDKLIFNGDYKDLQKKTKKRYSENQIMKAIPAVVTLYDVDYEGIILSINNETNTFPLSILELEDIFLLFKSFSFSEEVVANIQSYEFASRTGAIRDGSAFYGSKAPNPFDS